MSFDLGKLFIDWRRIVPNGIPNPNNDYHLVLLKEICLARGIDRDVVDNVILTLEKKEIDPDTPVKYKVGDKDQETTYGKAIVRDKDSEAYKAAKELEDKESGEKKDDKDSTSVAGPGLGDMIGPDGNYKNIPDISKWILSFGMLLGRLELFAVLVLFFPSFWRN